MLNLWWSVVESIIPFTTNQMRTLQEKYLYEQNGVNSSIRSLHCANTVNEMMGLAVSHSLQENKKNYDINDYTKIVSTQLRSKP